MGATVYSVHVACMHGAPFMPRTGSPTGMGKDRWDPRLDHEFKRLMGERKIMAGVIGAFVPEFEGRSQKEILDLWGEDGLVRLDADLPSPDGDKRMDMLYLVRLPDRSLAYLDLEGQLYRGSGSEDLVRALGYAVRVLEYELGKARAEGRRELRKVYSGWTEMGPLSAERNSIKVWRLAMEVRGPSGLLEQEAPGLLEVSMAGVWDPATASSVEEFRLDLLFYGGMDPDARDPLLREAFNLGPGDEHIIRGARAFHMNMSEEFKDHWKGIGREEGLLKGRAEGREEGLLKGRAEGREDRAVELVRGIMAKTGCDLESALAMLPDADAEEIRSAMGRRPPSGAEHGEDAHSGASDSGDQRGRGPGVRLVLRAPAVTRSPRACPATAARSLQGRREPPAEYLSRPSRAEARGEMPPPCFFRRRGWISGGVRPCRGPSACRARCGPGLLREHSAGAAVRRRALRACCMHARFPVYTRDMDSDEGPAPEGSL